MLRKRTLGFLFVGLIFYSMPTNAETEEEISNFCWSKHVSGIFDVNTLNFCNQLLSTYKFGEKVGKHSVTFSEEYNWDEGARYIISTRYKISQNDITCEQWRCGQMQYRCRKCFWETSSPFL